MNERQQELQRVARRFFIEIVYAFGSHSREAFDWIRGKERQLNFPRGADLDIGVKQRQGTNLHVSQKVQLALALEDLFSAPRIDLVVIPEADPFLAANIIRGERLFAEDEYLADEYELYILRRAGDCVPLERERMALILGEDE